MDAPEPAMHLDVGTKPLVIPIVRPFGQEVQVEVGEQWAEEIRIDKIPGMSLVVLHLEPVSKGLIAIGKDAR